MNKPVFSFIFLLVVVSYASIPLPNRNLALSKGLSGGAGLGSQYSSVCKNLFTWSGYGNYAYKPNLSGGVSVKFSGGNLDSTNSIIHQRYSINAMFIKAQPEYALFLGPTFSFENTDLNALIDDIHNIGSGNKDKSQTLCRELFSEIGSSIGYQTGIGYLINKDWGTAWGHSLDITLRGNYIIIFSASLAFNLRNHVEKLSENTKDFWLSIEYSNMATKKAFNIHNLLFGLALGF